MSKKIVPDSTRVKLWDEILKAIVDAMPGQLFPLFKEVYGKAYPRGTSITLLATESSTYRENPDAPPSSRLSDIALLVDGRDYYHLECQMDNEKDMVIRMIAYDLRLAMQYTMAEESGMLVMHFPNSTVIYPAKNEELPEILRCRLIFQDESEHIYQIPTVRIQSYSLEEIQKKHLMLFVPYLLLRVRPRLKIKGKNRLTKKELTEFVNEVMMILREELEEGYLTGQEYDDYINLFRRASERIFKEHKNFRKKVDEMTKPTIELPSVIQKRLRDKIELLEDEKESLESEKESLKSKNDSLMADLAAKEEELARLKGLLSQNHIPVTT